MEDYQKVITNSNDIKREISNILQQCRKELLIISSLKMLNLSVLSSEFLGEISIL